MKLDKPTQGGNQTDGARIPGQRTHGRVREFVASGRVEPAARDDAARAAAEARHGPRSPRVSVDELVAKGHTLIGRLEALVRRIAGRFRR